jgi:7-cyano-7-deazaguanine synthase
LAVDTVIDHALIFRDWSSIIGPRGKTNMTSCVVLFSGGLDSTTALAWALRRYDRVHALTFDYGQRHRVEITLARKAARRLGVPQAVLKVDLTPIGGSALTDPAIPLPRSPRRAARPSGPPATYVPFRNGIFLALAAAWAEARGIRDLVCGFHVADSPDYPDTTMAFVKAMEKAIRAGTRAAFGGPAPRIIAPLLGLDKPDIIRLGLGLGADYAYAVSCYAGAERPCGTCSSCRFRARAWKAVGREDPLLARLRLADPRIEAASRCEARGVKLSSLVRRSPRTKQMGPDRSARRIRTSHKMRGEKTGRFYE